ncbi:MAG: PAS domain S-box protein [Pseudomonadales bacterium]|nr:PAS domain S-box protein [Pseudomonadales bacterium]
MDESIFSARTAEVSCQDIGWCFDLCKDRQMEFTCILQNVPYPLEHLQNPACFIDWQSFAILFNNFLNYLSEAEIKVAGGDSWQSHSLRIYTIIGKLLHNLREQYTSAYGPVGFVAKHYPCELSLKEVYPGRIRIILKMNSGLIPCHAFQLALAGQMTGLPRVLGYPDANVEVYQRLDGAEFNVYYPLFRELISPLRKLFAIPFAKKNSAIELAHSQQALLEKYREIQTVKNQLLEARQQLTDSQIKYDLLAANVTDVIWITNLKLQLEYVSPSVNGLLGYTEAESLALGMIEILGQTSIDKIKEYISAARRGKLDYAKTHIFEAEIFRKDHRPVWVEVKSNFLLDQSGKTKQIVSVMQDVSIRRDIQTSLTNNEKSYRVITDTAQDAIFTFNNQGYITFANPSTARLCNYPAEALIGQCVKTIIPEAYNLAPQELTQLDHHNVILNLITSKMESISVEISFAQHQRLGSIFYTGIARDITQRNAHQKERDRLQAQLFAAQKIDSIGQLTGGIAHDFNNLLVAINGYADLGISKKDDPTNLQHYFSEIRLAGQRAADMTGKLLAFSRRQIIEPAIFDLRSLIDGLESMLERLIPENININFEQPSTALNILADKGQIEQLLVNLAVNSRDAMPGGGNLYIRCYNRLVDSDYAHLFNEAKPGNYAVMQVKDTGSGMQETLKNNIFEPFFTTKPEGAGTGLGLSVVFGIVKQHHGFIDVQSKMGIGSTFSIFLPLVEKVASPTLPTAQQSRFNGSEMLLIVEDNQQVRDLASIILSEAGYQVLTAADGIEALNTFRQQHLAIDLILMDVVMPRMGGHEVYEEMQLIQPDVKVIFTSGYAEQGIHTNFILEQGLDFLQKPYQTDSLLKRIHQVLDYQPDHSGNPAPNSNQAINNNQAASNDEANSNNEVESTTNIE